MVAKTAVLAALTLTAGLVTVAAAFAVSQAVLKAFAVPTVSITDTNQLRTTLLLSATFLVFPLMALALGTVLRSVAGAIAAA